MTAVAAIGRSAPYVRLRPVDRLGAHGRVARVHASSPPEDLSDLLGLVARGDQDAFAAVYDATVRSVFAIVLNVVRNRAQAEEVTQEVYLDAWRSAPRFDPAQGSPKAWLHTIAHRKAVDRVLSAQRSTDRDQRHFDQTRAGEDTPDVSELVIAHDDGRRVREALAVLPEPQRVAVQLAYFSGYSHSQVAERLQIPLGTAKTRIREAMRRLRAHLGEAPS
jgi:RNA polymerase sigma-70 factor, ECF subfamily